MGCLDNNALLGFVEGGLSPDQMQQVEEHIDRCSECRRLASELAEALVPAVEDEDATTRPDGRTSPPLAVEDVEQLPSGTMVDHYRVLGPIGRGGMGEVYLAEDTQLKRRVALKLIRGDCLGSRKVIDRFLLEARATARFSHPNIVGIYGVGEFDGRPYVALEFIEGQSLDRVMSGLPLQGAVRIALGIAEALHEAHRHNILHRDLKPANVIIGADGRARVLDFGIAKVLPGEPSRREGERALAAPDGRAADGEGPGADSTIEGAHPATVGFVGTPGYAAPEQWRGEPASSAGDVWALGMILYELSVGFHPYRGSRDGRAPAIAPGAPITYCQPAEAARGWLAELAMACLAVEPARRPRLPDIVQALRRWLRRNDTVSMRPIRRRRLAVVGACVAAAALASGGLAWWLVAGGPARSTDVASRPVSPEQRPAARVAAGPEGKPAASLAATVPRAIDRVSLETPPREAKRPTRAHASSKRKRPAARKKIERPATAKPEPINLDAPFPPR
jgi:serine/threonine protein kinase